MQTKINHPHVIKYQPTVIQELTVLVVPLAGIFGLGGWIVSKIKRNIMRK